MTGNKAVSVFASLRYQRISSRRDWSAACEVCFEFPFRTDMGSALHRCCCKRCNETRSGRFWEPESQARLSRVLCETLTRRRDRSTPQASPNEAEGFGVYWLKPASDLCSRTRLGASGPATQLPARPARTRHGESSVAESRTTPQHNTAVARRARKPGCRSSSGTRRFRV